MFGIEGLPGSLRNYPQISAQPQSRIRDPLHRANTRSILDRDNVNRTGLDDAAGASVRSGSNDVTEAWLTSLQVTHRRRAVAAAAVTTEDN